MQFAKFSITYDNKKGQKRIGYFTYYTVMRESEEKGESNNEKKKNSTADCDAMDSYIHNWIGSVFKFGEGRRKSDTRGGA